MKKTAPNKSVLARLGDWVFGPYGAPITSGSATTPPSRLAAAAPRAVDPREALGLGSVFRAVQILSTAMQQMPIEVYRGNEKLDPAPLWIRQPDLNSSRAAFLEETATSLALAGNAYWRIDRDSQSRVTNLEVLNPLDISIDATKSGRVTGYQYLGGTKYAADRIQHLSYLRVPGTPYGLGPIQAAYLDLRGALDVRDYSAGWFTDSGVPGGILSSTQTLSADQAGEYKSQWVKGMSDDSRLAVLGAGLEYKALLLTPEQAQWLASQNFNISQVARMFGIPAGLLLAAIDGSSETYSNISQMWTEFSRFTLSNYRIEIEEAFSALLPRGTDAKLNVEGLLRADTSTRYSSYESALRAGWMLRSEIRTLEDLPPVEGIDDLPAPAPTATPTKEAASA